MRKEFLQIARDYTPSRQDDMEQHPTAKFIRGPAANAVLKSLAEYTDGFLVKGSSGQTRWAEVPWIAVFDPAITTGARGGHYVVYLFSADMKHLYLSLNQGTTSVRKEIKRNVRDELRRRARAMRARLPNHIPKAIDAPISLHSSRRLALDYEAAHVIGIHYDLADLPSDNELQQDLQLMTSLYTQLSFRGGITPPEEMVAAKEEVGLGTISEQRRYTYHRKIERQSDASRKAKKALGYICQACGFDFEKTYGEIGKKFIEAHHLVPLSELPEDRPVNLDPKTDFAVLCANCHRMIHRAGAPRTIEEFRSITGLKTTLDRSNP